MYQERKACRICGNTELVLILDLGIQALTGVFPRPKDPPVPTMPLQLVKCLGDPQSTCGLVQLRHSAELSQLYGDNYGYRSGINASMVSHLHEKVKKLLSEVTLNPGDLVLDIGSNDSALLQAYPKQGLLLVGIDPSGDKFKSYYPSHIRLIPEFFSGKSFLSYYGNKKAKIVTSCSMFYDLEDPTAFMREISEILDDHGVWVSEQSYLPSMLAANSYDTVCHEHLEYYALRQIQWMAERVGFEILDVQINDVNGGSFSFTLAKKGIHPYKKTLASDHLSSQEKQLNLDGLDIFKNFSDRIAGTRNELLSFFAAQKKEQKTVLGYGASTKGNVLLQYCGITEKDLPSIAEVNENKFGCFTPGTHIPIISEAKARSCRPDYFLVLPWHFKENILSRETAFRQTTGTQFVFPLPHLLIK